MLTYVIRPLHVRDTTTVASTPVSAFQQPPVLWAIFHIRSGLLAITSAVLVSLGYFEQALRVC